jgi:hypothetical protein
MFSLKSALMFVYLESLPDNELCQPIRLVPRTGLLDIGSREGVVRVGGWGVRTKDQAGVLVGLIT